MEKLIQISQKWFQEVDIENTINKRRKDLKSEINKKRSFAIQSDFFIYTHFLMQYAFENYLDGNIEKADQLFINAHEGVSQMLPLHIHHLLEDAREDEEFDHPYQIFEGGLRIGKTPLYFNCCLSYLLDKKDEFSMYAGHIEDELSRVLSMAYDMDSHEPDFGIFCSSLPSLITKNKLADNPGWWQTKYNNNVVPFEGLYIDLLQATDKKEIETIIYQCIDFRLKRSTTPIYSYFEVGYCALMPFELMCYIKYLKENKDTIINIDHPLFDEKYTSLPSRVSNINLNDDLILKAIDNVKKIEGVK